MGPGTAGDRRIVVSLKAARIAAQDKLSDRLPRVGMDVEIVCVGGRRYGCRGVLLYSQRRLLMWKQTDKSPFREVTINYFKWP
jgi:hypothetical protein